MASKVPSVSVRFEAAKKALEGPAQVLVLGPIGAGGTASPGTVFKVIDEADTAAMVGDSEINDAVALWFDANLQQRYDLYVLGYDTTGWAANTWKITVAAGTAAASGTINIRFGEHHVPVAVAKDDDQDAVATKITAALTASQAPLAAVVNGVNANEVDITSDYVGLHTQRIPLSVDLYRDRGELGVDGITTSITNNADGSGEPAFSATPITEAYDWYLHTFRGTAYLDALETHLQARWDQKNDFAHAVLALAGSPSSVTTFGDARNDAHHTYVGISDAPMFELSAAVAFLDGVERQIRSENKPNISGQRMTLPRMPVFPTALDVEALLDAGVTPLRSQRSTVLAVRAVANKRENDVGAEDLRQYDLGAVLALREIGTRLVLWATDQLGKGIVADGTPLTPRLVSSTTSEGRLRGTAVEVLKGLWRDAVIFAPAEDALDGVLSSVQPVQSGGILTGFELIFDPELVRAVTNLDIFVRFN